MRKLKVRIKYVEIKRGNQELVFNDDYAKTAIRLIVNDTVIAALCSQVDFATFANWVCEGASDYLRLAASCLYIGDYYIALYHDRQAQQIDFNGPFTKQDIINAFLGATEEIEAPNPRKEAIAKIENLMEQIRDELGGLSDE